MGTGRFDAHAYAAYTSTTVGKSTDKIYTRTSMDFDSVKGSVKSMLDPKGVVVRESRDSPDNPRSTPIIMGLDVTGSMGMIADTIAREGLGVLFTEILKRRPVSDPHLMFMGIGDIECDRAPLQVSQFEADARIIEQLTDLWLEHGGGGNAFESYHLPWYFAARHTSIDSFEKRGEKGFLFTVGDEEPPPHPLTVDQAKGLMDVDLQDELDSLTLLKAAQEMYEVYHIIIAQGSHMSSPTSAERVTRKWRELLGQNVIILDDYTKLAEVVVSTIQIAAGEDHDKVAKSWAGGTSVVVANATRSLAARSTTGSAAGVARL